MTELSDFTKGPGDVLVSTVTFGEDAISIQYVEAREQTNAAGLARSLIIDADHIKEEMADLHDLCVEIIDRGLTLIRNPPKRLRRGDVMPDDTSDDIEDDE